MKKTQLLLCLSLACFGLQAQQVIINAGKIEYEKKVNMHKVIGDDDAWLQEVKDKKPAYRLSYYNLFFNDTAAVYRAGKENKDDPWKNFWGSSTGDEDVLISSLTQRRMDYLKQVFEKKFLVQDSLLPIAWRITNDTREIAGFTCRKAVGKLFDSLYVIAFYTEQITPPTGPAMYGGLPGTILGLAFPRYYTTLFATQVSLMPPSAADFLVPKAKAKSINRREWIDITQSGYSNWGNESQKQQNLWMAVLL